MPTTRRLEIGRPGRSTGRCRETWAFALKRHTVNMNFAEIMSRGARHSHGGRPRHEGKDGARKRSAATLLGVVALKKWSHR